MGEIIVILIVAVLVLGPEKLPSTIMQIAKVLKALKKQVDDAKESIEKELRVSEIKKEADKYKNEFSEYNENIRKKLSFEEFDELKSSVNKGIDELKESVNFNSSAGAKSASNAGVAGENLAGAEKITSGVANSAVGVNYSENLAKNSASVANVDLKLNDNSTNAAQIANAEFSTPNGKISREKAQMLGLDILENSNENGANFGETLGENSHFFAENSVNLNENSAKNSTNSNTTKIAENSSKISTKNSSKTKTAQNSAKSTQSPKISVNKTTAKAQNLAKTTPNSKAKITKNSTNSAQNSRSATKAIKTTKTNSTKTAKNSTPKTKNSTNLAKNSAKTLEKVEKSNV